MKYPILIKITYTQICNISRCSMYSSSYDETSSDRSERLFKMKKKLSTVGTIHQLLSGWMKSWMRVSVDCKKGLCLSGLNDWRSHFTGIANYDGLKKRWGKKKNALIYIKKGNQYQSLWIPRQQNTNLFFRSLFLLNLVFLIKLLKVAILTVPFFFRFLIRSFPWVSLLFLSHRFLLLLFWIFIILIVPI